MKPTNIDKLVAKLLPRLVLPEHLRPADLLDDAVVPPLRVAEKVYALRQLVRSGGRDEPLTGKLATSEAVAQFFSTHLRDEKTESLWVAGTDSHNRITLVRVVARGGVSGCAAMPMDLLRPVIINACAAFFVVHNHPSGMANPSVEDIAFTERVRQCAALLGLKLLDHLIIGAAGYFSFCDAALLPRTPM